MPTTPNIILTGFMGTGKSAVGQAVAERLGRWFIDTDGILVQRAGKSIAALFAEDGEDVFRRMEAELCQELAREQALVIATGGGTLLDPASRAALAASGVVICLDASLDALLDRLGSADDRPLLAGAAGEDRRARMEALLAARAAAYAAIPDHIDTTGLSVEEVAARVIRLARQRSDGAVRLPVRFPGGQYEIVIGEGILLETGHALAAAGLRPGPCAVVTQPAVAAEHGGALLAALEETGFAPALVEIPAGEAYKTLDTVAGLYDAFIAARLDRRAPVLALGGGVTGDVAGFAAATYLRGVPFVQLPTTLLSMVDASVGGKTGVDLPQGKNLVGAFKQPSLVLIDTETLRSLPSAEFVSGLAEVVKSGMIGDPALFAAMEGAAGAPRLTLVELIQRAVQVKVDVVEADPFEEGRRAVLNLGHTFGHALEQVSGYHLRHGEAVSVGLAAATRLAGRLGLCDSALAARVESLLARLGLPVRAPGFAAADVMAAMSTDKKRSGARLRFVLPREIGQVEIVEETPALAAALPIVCDEICN